MTAGTHRAIAWGVFLGCLYLLRDYLPLFLLTFVFTFLMQGVVARLGRFGALAARPRLVLSCAYVLLVLHVAGLGWSIGPRLVREGRAVAGEYAQRLEVERARHAEEEAAREETVRRARGRARPAPDASDTAAATDTAAEGVRGVVDRAAESVLGTEAARTFRTTDVYAAVVERFTEAGEGAVAHLADNAIDFAKGVPFLTLQFALSILFSFLILWDMPALAAGVRSMEHGRLARLYAEIAPDMSDFGRVLGKSFQALFVVAIWTTILTGIGLVVLGIPQKILLLAVVFLLSFIPVVGAVLSTVPIALVALKIGGGAPLLLAVVAMVGIVHAIITYIVTPRIYGQALHMNPVVVLFVLLVGEHLAGVWGLILSVPVAFYVFEYVVQGKTGWPPKFPGGKV